MSCDEGLSIRHWLETRNAQRLVRFALIWRAWCGVRVRRQREPHQPVHHHPLRRRLHRHRPGAPPPPRRRRILGYIGTAGPSLDEPHNWLWVWQPRSCGRSLRGNRGHRVRTGGVRGLRSYGKHCSWWYRAAEDLRYALAGCIERFGDTQQRGSVANCT